MRSADLGNFIPIWRGKKVESLRITGQSGKNLENWIFPPLSPSIFQQKAIVGLLMEIGVLVVMGVKNFGTELGVGLRLGVGGKFGVMKFSLTPLKTSSEFSNIIGSVGVKKSKGVVS